MKLRKLYENISKEIGFLAYHGSPTEFSNFSDEFVGTEEATDQEGPGVYFTTDYDDAAGYGGYLYTVKLRGRFLSDKASNEDVDRVDIEKMIRMGNEWEMNAQNWGEDYEAAIPNIIEDFIQYNTNQKDVFLQIWYDFYRYEPVLYVRNMVKLGYDGLVIDRTKEDGKMRTHIIIYNLNSIKFVEKEIVVNEELTYRHADTKGVEDDEYKIGMIKEGITPLIAYHGRKSKYNNVRDLFNRINNEGTDQEGAGVYFTTKADEAIKYASPNGYVYEVELHPQKMLSDKPSFDNEHLIPKLTKLIKSVPNWKRFALSYDDDINDGLYEMVYRYASMGQSEKEVFVNLYHDVFKGNALGFVKGMAKLGYDALYLPAKDGGAHIVAYNPNIVNILEIKQMS